jgi:hypothetical protein
MEAARTGHSGLVKNFPDESSALLMSMTMLTTAAPTAEAAADNTRQTFNELLLPAVDNPAVYLIVVKDVLGYRYSVMHSLLTTGEHTNHETFKVGGILSPASKGLFSDSVLGFAAYISCMWASLSPAIWAYPIPRAGGVILLLFGTAISGQEALARDKIQLLSPMRHALEEDDVPSAIAAEDFVSAAQWWTGQLSTLFSIITEPANYEDSQGDFDRRQQQNGCSALSR